MFTRLFICLGIILSLAVSQAKGFDRPVVILMTADSDAYNETKEGILDQFKGQNVVILNLENNPDSIDRTMDKIATISAKALIAVGPLSVEAVSRHPVHSPVVFCMVVNQEEGFRKIPDSYGVAMHLPLDEAFERIRYVLPKGTIAVPYNPALTGQLINEITSFFKNKRIKVLPIPMEKPDQMSENLENFKGQYDALWILPDASLINSAITKYLINYSVKEKIPLIGFSEKMVKAGFLISLEGNYREIGVKAGEVSRSIMSGKVPERLSYISEFRTFVNKQIAAYLDIKINPTLFALSQRVYPLE